MKNNGKTGKLIIISAPSGTGKSTVIKKILKTRRDIFFSVSATTRKPRKGEIDGASYMFVSREKFEQMIVYGEFLEYAEYVGDYYGTPKKPIFDNLEQGRDVILDIDVQGAKQIIAMLPMAVTVFLVPPDMLELERRLRSRGTDSEEKLSKRMERAKTELCEIDDYNYVVVNDDVARAADEIISIIDGKASCNNVS